MPQSTTLGLYPIIHVPNYMDYYLFTDPWGMDGWVGHVGWPIADVWPTKWSSVQLAVWRRIGKVCRPDQRSTHSATPPTKMMLFLCDVYRLTQWCYCHMCVNACYRRPACRSGECRWRSIRRRCGTESSKAGLLGREWLARTSMFLVLPIWDRQSNGSVWWEVCCSAWSMQFSAIWSLHLMEVIPLVIDVWRMCH